MATINVDRPRAYVGGPTGGMNGPPVLNFPIGTSETCVEGDMVIPETGATGLVSMASSNADPATVIGISEVKITTAPTAGTPTPVTLILPNFIYEMSDEGNAVDQTLILVPCPVADNATFGAVADTNGTGTNDIVNPIGFLGNMFGFVTRSYSDKAETSPPTFAGNTTQIHDISKGTAGDTSPRLLVTFTSAGCELVG